MEPTKTTATTDTDALLATAKTMDLKRRISAVNEFAGYRLLTGGDLLNLKTGDVYQVIGRSGCSCPDFTGRVGPMRERMTAAGVATACCDKHFYIARLLRGQTVTIGNSVFRAKKK